MPSMDIAMTPIEQVQIEGFGLTEGCNYNYSRYMEEGCHVITFNYDWCQFINITRKTSPIIESHKTSVTVGGLI